MATAGRERKPDAHQVTVRKADTAIAVQENLTVKKSIDKVIGRKLENARHRYGPGGIRYVVRTQEDVAQVLGLHRPAIAEIEAGRRKLTAAELVLVAEWLGCPVTELLP